MKRCVIYISALFLILCSSGCSEANDEHHHNDATDVSGYMQDGVRIIELRALKYKFEPDPIVVKYGEKVRLVAKSADVTHGIEIPDFKVNLPVFADKTSNAEFVADKKGTFHAHCSIYCGPGHAHMHGTLIVK